MRIPLSGSQAHTAVRANEIVLLDRAATDGADQVFFRVGAADSCCPENQGTTVFSEFHDADTVDLNAANDNVRVVIEFVGKPKMM